LASVVRAAQLAGDDYKIVVAPGTYQGDITTNRRGKEPQRLQFIADVSGAQTGTAAGPVMIEGGSTAGIDVTKSSGAMIDGFTVFGTKNVGILIRNGSDGLIIQNCVVHDNDDDGIHVQDSEDVLIFNNLIYNNSGHGVALVGSVSGSPNGQVISNTIYHNAGHGIQFGSSTGASPNGFVRNNIVENNANGTENIKVFTNPRSDLNHDEDFDLVSPPTYFPTNPPLPHPHDISDDAQFVSTSRDDFHLQSSGCAKPPTHCSPAINAGDPNLDASLAIALRSGTTTGTGLDTGRIDLGFHYPP
jgi:parallel beta-helix repeat protein